MYAMNRKISHELVIKTMQENNISASEGVMYNRIDGKIVEEKIYYLTHDITKKLDIALAKDRDNSIVISNGRLSIRYIMDGEIPLFVARDIASQLGYSDTNKMTSRLDNDEFISAKMEGMNMKVTLLTESGLYNAILGSKKPEAKQFKRFVTEEVLPSIRKHGMYATTDTIEKMIADPESAIKLLEAIKSEKEKSKELRKEITTKQRVIDSMVKDCPLPDKRQVLNIVLRKTGTAFHERWQQLYNMFDKTYRRNTQLLVNNYNVKNGTKLSRLDYIQDILGQLDDLYTIAVKLYETDINQVINKMFEIV